MHDDHDDNSPFISLRQRLRWEQELERERQLSEIRNGPPASPDRMIWTGTAREFGDWILEAFDNGLIQASSRFNALEEACKHFVSKGGKPLNHRSIWQSLRNRKEVEGK